MRVTLYKASRFSVYRYIFEIQLILASFAQVYESCLFAVSLVTTKRVVSVFGYVFEIQLMLCTCTCVCVHMCVRVCVCVR